MLLVCTHVAPGDTGGVAASARRWSRGARALGVEVLWGHVRGADGPVDLWRDGTLVSSGLARASLTDHARSAGTRAVLLHYCTTASATALAVHDALGLPLLASLRGNDVTLGVFAPDGPLEAVVDAAHHVIAVADHLLLLAEARFGGVRRRATVVPNWLLPDEVAALAPAARPERPPVFGLVGVWKWKKGLEVALDALAAVPHLVGQVRIFGDLSRLSDHGRRTYDALRGRGLPEACRFEPTAAREIYERLDVVVVPSLVEGMPNVMLEGMAAGCAVVGARVPGIAEVLVDGESGRMFDAGDASALAALLDLLAGEPAEVRRLGHAGQRLARRVAGNPWLRLPAAVRRTIGADA